MDPCESVQGKTTWVIHSSDAAIDFVRRVRLGSCDSFGTNNSRSVLGIAPRLVAMRNVFAVDWPMNPLGRWTPTCATARRRAHAGTCNAQPRGSALCAADAGRCPKNKALANYRLVDSLPLSTTSLPTCQAQ